MPSRFILLILAAALMASSVSSAAEVEGPQTATLLPPPKIHVSDDGATLYLIGAIIPGTYFDFIAAVRKNAKIRTVYLGSQGGTARDGLLIANQVRRRNLDTYVGHYCASTCTQIFLAGKQRGAAPLAQIGFHKSFVVDDKGVVLGESEDMGPQSLSDAMGYDGDNALRLSYKRAGLADEFIERVLKVPSSEMWHPTREELIDAMVVTLGDIAVPAPPDDETSYAAVLQFLADKPFWQVSQTSFPDVFEDASRQIWRFANVGVPMEKALWMARQKLVDKAIQTIPSTADAMIDFLAVQDGKYAAWQRSKGYPDCSEERKIAFDVPSGEMLQHIQAQEFLFVAMLRSSERVVPLTPEKAMKEYRKSVGQFARFGLLEPNRPDDPHYDCRLGFQINQSIALLEPKKRIRAYRALASAP